MENQFYSKYYIDPSGSRRKYGIYCHSFDRWLLIDNYDVSATLETGQLLSSKVANIIYALPNNILDMNNNNCLDYTIFDKTGYVRGKFPDVIKGQTPLVKIVDHPAQIYLQGVPEDFKEADALNKLKELKQYAEFVHNYVYVLKFLNANNWDDNASFSKTILSDQLLEGVSLRKDRSNLEEGLISEIKKILCFGMSVEESKTKIDNLIESVKDQIPQLIMYHDRLLSEI